MTSERVKEIVTELFLEIEETLKQSEGMNSSEARAEFYQQALLDARFWLLEGIAEIQDEQPGAAKQAQQAAGPEMIRKQMKLLN